MSQICYLKQIEANFSLINIYQVRMGCAHDDPEECGCKPNDKDGSFFVMSPVVHVHTIRWSPCSRAFIEDLFELVSFFYDSYTLHFRNKRIFGIHHMTNYSQNSSLNFNRSVYFSFMTLGRG